MHAVACANFFFFFLLLCYLEFDEYSKICVSIFLIAGIQVVSSLGPIVNKAGMKINNIG